MKRHFRRAVRPASWKYLLIWPLFPAYRRKLKRSVRWRLADSHVTAVWSSVIGLCVILLTMTVVWAWLAFPNDRELRDETEGLAFIVGQFQRSNSVTTQDVSALLDAISRGAIYLNPGQGSPNFQVSIGRNYANIRSISVAALDGGIIASSEPAYIGRPFREVLPRAADLGAREIATDPKSDRRFSEKFPDGSAIGTAKIRDASGDVTGILIVDKAKLTYSSPFGLVRDAFTIIAQIGLVLLLMVGLPAIPISIVIGIKRGRAIARPISALAVASERLADGDLDTRVDVRGDDEIGTLQRGFNVMAARLQESMRRESEQRERSEELLAANRELIANVSHELRTPVALIRGHLEAIDDKSAESKDYVRIAVRETDRLERLVDDLFQLTRIENKRVDLELSPFNPASAAREAVETLAEPARREAGILIRADANSDDGQCDGDRARFVQVLMNLIRNAIRYTPEGGIILVATQGGASTIEVSIRDTGSGIAPDDLPHVFDRFYRADPSRNRASGGAGLGLAIARELIEAMGGTIDVASALDEGTTFTIQMPRSHSPLVENGHSPARTASK